MPTETADNVQVSDEELVSRVLAGENAEFETLMRRNNRRVYRVARAVLHDDAEAEDVAQEAYVRAYQHLDQFQGRSSFATWLISIAFHEALARVRKRARHQEIDAMDESSRDSLPELSVRNSSPEQDASTSEIASLLEDSIDTLPDKYRQVFMLRDVEEMSTADTAACLGISEENVKIRLYRARALMRKKLYARAGAKNSAAFQFMGERCDRLVHTVMTRIARLEPAWKVGPVVCNNKARLS
jgi:RNA polymerase sigma-70 factor (ECF subfamily)